MKILSAIFIFSITQQYNLQNNRYLAKKNYLHSLSLDKNETQKDDCAIIPKKQIPRHTPVWKPAKHY